jgi:carbamoyltransferase
MRILGISAFYHDSACALIEDGEILAAAQEERFSRKKHDSGFPAGAVAYCLGEGGCRLDKVDYVVFYEKPFLKFERLLETYLRFAPRGLESFQTALPLWIHERMLQRQLLKQKLEPFGSHFDWESRLLFTEHHVSHAASAFFPSPFGAAAVLTMDGVGEWATTTAAVGHGNRLQILKEIQFPHSLGLLYSAMTYYTGFKVNSGEYKLMGLAPYGEPKYAQRILEQLLDLKPDGSFRLNMRYFNYCTGLTMTNSRFDDLFGGPPRTPDLPLTQHHMDLAASVQAVLEEAVLRLTRSLAAETGLRKLCLAGGVALNCVANGKVLRDGAFEELWIQPAAGDAGGAIGAAFAAFHLLTEEARIPSPRDSMRGSYLGPAFDQSDIEHRLAAAGAKYEVLSEDALLDACVDGLVSEQAVGWFQGRMEFGPRALGARSILADARSPNTQSRLNLKVKFRESFRPFAPSVLREQVSEWFDFDAASPYMLLVAPVAERRRISLGEEYQHLFGIDKIKAQRSTIPAVTHVDYSARIQTVASDTNPRYHALLSRFHRRTGCPVLANTSFNVRGEPIVCSPEDAFRCFMGTDIEALAVGNCFLRKTSQNACLKSEYARGFEPD